MRIGVVTTSYPRWGGDPAGSFVEGHVRALRALGHEIEVIAAADDARDDGVRDGGQDDQDRGARADGRRDERGRHDGGHDRARRTHDRAAVAPGAARDDENAKHRGRDQAAAAVGGRGGARHERIDASRGVEVVRVPSGGLFYRGGAPDLIERQPSRILDAAWFTARFAATVVRRARRWDQVIAHWLPCAVAALPARKPLTAIVHGGDLYTLRRLGLLAPTLRALGGARLVFVSDELRALANDPAGIVQPMGVDLAHFAALGRAPTTPPTILFAGRLVPIKGADTAIEAMTHLPHARLVIAGDGPERRALEARAFANTARGRAAPVTFLGAVDTAHRDRLLREASVVVVPSRTLPNGRTEGCPTIAIEALAAGVPVVATIGRASELVPPDDPAALAAAIERVLASPPATRPLVADLDWRDVAQRLVRNE